MLRAFDPKRQFQVDSLKNSMGLWITQVTRNKVFRVVKYRSYTRRYNGVDVYIFTEDFHTTWTKMDNTDDQ